MWELGQGGLWPRSDSVVLEVRPKLGALWGLRQVCNRGVGYGRDVSSQNPRASLEWIPACNLEPEVQCLPHPRAVLWSKASRGTT